MTSARPRVVVVGAGFAGLSAARRLQNEAVDVTLVDRNNFHTFTPLLYQVASAGLEPEEIAQPVRRILRGAANLRFRLGEVTGVDFEARRVVLQDGLVEYDYLVLAAGSATNYFGVEGAGDVGLGLKDINEASVLRNHLLLQFEEAAAIADATRRRGLMTIVVVGGGPTGVEMAGAVAELVYGPLVHDYPELAIRDQARIVLIEMGDRLLAAYPSKLSAVAQRRLAQLGVEVRLGEAVSRVAEDGVHLKDGSFIAAGSVLWVAGVRAALLTDDLKLDLGPSRRVRVEPTLQLARHRNVFVAGDMSFVSRPDNETYPMLAPVAMQQGKTAAQNILRLIDGRAPEPFAYRDLGTMATIGRNSAVAKMGPLQFGGFIAWLMWLTLHLFWLIGLRNRLLVLTNWAWNYIFFDRAVRLITGPKSQPPEKPPAANDPP